MLANWKTWCRLCASDRASIKLESVDIINCVLSTHLQVSISDINDVSLSICEECYTFTNKLQWFKERCEQTNRLFIYLSNIKMVECDVEEIRSRYLDDLVLDDVAERLKDDLEVETQHLMSIMPLNEIESNGGNEKRKVGKQEIYFKVETLDTPADHDGLNINSSDTDQWDPEYAEYENVPVCSSEPESVDEKKDEIVYITDPVPDTESLDPIIEAESECDNDSKTLPTLRGRTYRGRPSSNTRRQMYQCDICFKKFSSSSYLKKHEAVHVSDGEKTLYSCSLCDKMFTKAINVKAHIRLVHNGDKPFICEGCGKPFGSKGALKEHYIVHTEERPYPCTRCPKRFKNAARLRTHEDIHNDTLYVCPHCGLKLNTKRTLNMHMVVHSDQKKYKCQYCGNEYKRSKALKAHLILHTGLRPYQCPFCDRSFANGSNCRSHKKKFHPLELAALEAAGGQKPTVNIPKLAHLQSKSQSNVDEPQSTEQSTEVIIDNTDQQNDDTKLKAEKKMPERTTMANILTTTS